MTNKMIILAFGVAITSLATSAFAADIAVDPPPPPAVVVYPGPFAPVVAVVALPVTIATAIIAAASSPHIEESRAASPTKRRRPLASYLRWRMALPQRGTS